MSRVVGVIDTRVANTASIFAGLRRAGLEPVAVGSAADLEGQEAVVLPGVGAFAAGMSALDRMCLVEPLQDWIAADRPFLSVCLGMQLLFESSEESPGVAGLGVVPGAVTRFPDGVVIPHFGWNQIASSSDFFADGDVYFANSFRATEAPEGWETATCDHGGSFLAGIRKGRVAAVQFHPEISGAVGASLLDRWAQW
ncbi:MAG: imidazole glycerol phosphate synthase subunit HisH [Armatimonadota bacterium]